MKMNKTNVIWAITFVGASGLLACGDDETASTANTGGSTTTTTTTASTGGAGQGGSAQGGSATGGSSSGGNAQGGSATGGNGTGGATAGKQLDITIIDGLQQMPAALVQVCEQGAANNCGTTSATGTLTLFVTENQETILEYTKSGFRKHLLSVRGDAGPTVSTLLVPDIALTLSAGQLGIQLDPTKGHVVGGVMTTPEGATASMDPAATVIYLSSSGSPDSNLQATSTAGAFALLNASTGRGVVTINQPSSVGCKSVLGIPMPGENTVDVPVEADAITVASTFDCP